MPTDPLIRTDLSPREASHVDRLDRAALRDKLPAFLWPLLGLILKALLAALPLMFASRQLVRSGVTSQPKGIPLPNDVPGVLRAEIEAIRADS